MSIVIVGAAGGIGTAVTRKFTGAGFQVAGFDREPAQYKSPNYTHSLGDFTNVEQVREFAAEIGEQVEHLIIVAGGAEPGEVVGKADFTEVNPETVLASLNKNLTGVILTAQSFLPYLREARSVDKSIIVTSSVNAYQGIGLPVYSAAKAGILSLVSNLAVSEGSHGVRVNGVAPGTVVTDRTVEMFKDDPDHFSSLLKTTALNSLTSVEDVADVFFFLAGCRAITGETVVVDSGQLAKGFRI